MKTECSVGASRWFRQCSFADGLRRVGGFSEVELEQASREYPEPLQGHEMLYVEH